MSGALIGGLLLALYLVVLTRSSLDAAMGNPPLLGGWKSLAGVLALAIALVAVAGALSAGWSGRRILVWIAAHAELLSVSGLTLAALAIRVYGISDNLPYINYPDEPAVADRALQILQTGDYNPHYFVYPNLYTYMQAGVDVVRFLWLVSAGQAQNLSGVVPTDFYLWGRLLTAVLGTLTVPIVYVVGKRLYSPVVGGIAAVFMAINSLHLVFSQLITTDVPATFFTALSLLAIVHLLPPRPDDVASAPARYAPVGGYLLAGIALGLAVGAKYNSALVVLPFLLAHLFVSSRMAGGWLRGLLNGRLWLALGTMVITFLATTPFAIFDLPSFLNDVASVISHYKSGHVGHEGDSNWLFYVNTFLRTDTLPTLLTLAGIVLAFVRHRKADVLLLAFPISFYLSMSDYRVNFTRNLLPILPFTSILAALPLVALARVVTSRFTGKERRQRWVASGTSTWALTAVAGLMVLPVVLSAIHRDHRQSEADTRFVATKWLDANTDPGTKIWLEPWTPALSPSRYIFDGGQHVTEHPMDWYTANHFEYVIVSTGAYKEVVYDNPNENPDLRQAYLNFFQQNASRVVADFDSNELDREGPSVRIYSTGYSPPRKPEELHATYSIGALFHEDDANGGTVQLVGADYPLTTTIGSALPLTLYWLPDRQLHRDYTVFVHLLSDTGGVPAQRDTQPRSGTYPSSQWRPGEIVADDANLTLPDSTPPGDYMLRVGLYLQQDGQAITAFHVDGGSAPSNGSNYVLLGPVTVMSK
jgi:4-amino-4-deoxy-L-arabinose transferase-like glycosyltransferase